MEDHHLDDANNSLAELIETLAFLESLKQTLSQWPLKHQKDVSLTRDLKETRKASRERMCTRQQILPMTELNSCSMCIKPHICEETTT